MLARRQPSIAQLTRTSITLLTSSIECLITTDLSLGKGTLSTLMDTQTTLFTALNLDRALKKSMTKTTTLRNQAVVEDGIPLQSTKIAKRSRRR